MSDRKRNTLSADRALPHRISSYISAPDANHPRPRQPMAPSAPPTQSPRPTWAGNPCSSGAYHQLPTPNANVAHSASSSTQVPGPRRPKTNGPKFHNPTPIRFWRCCHCKYNNHPQNCPELCLNCPHMKCPYCLLNITGEGALGFEGNGD